MQTNLSLHKHWVEAMTQAALHKMDAAVSRARGIDNAHSISQMKIGEFLKLMIPNGVTLVPDVFEVPGDKNVPTS